MDNGWKSKKDKNGHVTHYRTNNAKKPYGVSRELAAVKVYVPVRVNKYAGGIHRDIQFLILPGEC